MDVQQLGFTRSAHRPDHLLQTPDTFIRASFRGISNGTAIIHIAPARGAAFTQYTAELEPGGTLAPMAHQRFVYVMEGSLNKPRELGPGSFAFFPANALDTIEASTRTRLAVIEKPYQPASGTERPGILYGHEPSTAAQFLLNDPAIEVRTLLPATHDFDFAMNTLTFQPGASLPLIEVHVMEHGLVMLEGGGIYRLNDSWYPVTRGDFIWMAPYCPQWFGALGKTPAKYLLYKDFNRAPLA